MKTENKVWLVTGANKGIGAAITKELLAQGYHIAPTARNTESADKELGNHPSLLIVKLNATHEEEIKQAVTAATERFGF
ncbi:MAG: SDR family NAD(P)-dependent oxidoreductase [Tannerellaceae bacterium]|nr:SDR family NAD(P)-dependent oxidoreductase [Tannerellaceae bacterium]MCD8264543.1 SDR family NAD(P)-dependent oxidoreductase [Tannerellaceae bacterium]